MGNKCELLMGDEGLIKEMDSRWFASSIIYISPPLPITRSIDQYPRIFYPSLCCSSSRPAVGYNNNSSLSSASNVPGHATGMLCVCVCVGWFC